MKNVVLLGATGSIGTSSVDVIHQHSDIFNLYVKPITTTAWLCALAWSPWVVCQSRLWTRLALIRLIRATLKIF